VAAVAAPTPALPAFSDGEVTSAAQLNAIAANATNLYAYLQGGFRIRRPMAAVRVVKENREILTNTDTRIGWDASDIDTDNMWTGVTSEPLSVHTAGWYRVGFLASLQAVAGPATSIIAARIAVLQNGGGARNISTQAIAVGYGPGLNGLDAKTNCSAVVQLASGDQLDFWVTHTLGVTTSLANNRGGTRAYALWLGPL
jgi:hypothetical protein